MTAGMAEPIKDEILLEEYFSNLHRAHASLRQAFADRAGDGLTQDDLAKMLRTDKAAISRRLNGQENFTLKTLSYLATALRCRLNIVFQRQEDVAPINYFSASFEHDRTANNKADLDKMLNAVNHKVVVGRHYTAKFRNSARSKVSRRDVSYLRDLVKMEG